MKKIKEFFEWLNADAAEWVVAGFTVSSIAFVCLGCAFILVTSPTIFLLMVISAGLFFVLQAIYLFYKENKNVSNP